MKGYKIFNPDFTCRGVQYSENEVFEVEGTPIICQHGIHFCAKASHLFNYYSFDSSNIVCEVEAIGEMSSENEGNKFCTNKLKVGRRLTWAEVLAVANEGLNNTGHSNTGYRNTGYCNTGNRNTGDSNTGDRNTGYWNTGDRNTGHSNTGYCNTGNRNTGNSNTGYRNTGHSNTGYCNTGNRNTGDSNTGDRNTGDSNTGDSNTGDRNTGDSNTGDSNTGYCNTGNRNTGVFCTGVKTLEFFDKKSDWTEETFFASRAYAMLCQLETKMWIEPYQMTAEEKAKHPSWETCDGYLKDIPFKEAFQNAWGNWGEESRSAFKELPNFDAAIFELITGVKC